MQAMICAAVLKLQQQSAACDDAGLHPNMMHSAKLDHHTDAQSAGR